MAQPTPLFVGLDVHEDSIQQSRQFAFFRSEPHVVSLVLLVWITLPQAAGAPLATARGVTAGLQGDVIRRASCAAESIRRKAAEARPLLGKRSTHRL
jgi:hypothetical protein